MVAKASSTIVEAPKKKKCVIDRSSPLTAFVEVHSLYSRQELIFLLDLNWKIEWLSNEFRNEILLDFDIQYV